MISCCDQKFFGYVVNMFKSFQKFNKNTKMFFGNVDCTLEQLEFINELGITIVESDQVQVLKQRKMSLTFLDCLLGDYLKGVNFDKVMWVDADTLILRNIEGLFNYKEDFVGHSGRNNDGSIISVKGDMYISPGLWVTKSKTLLKELLEETKVTEYKDEDGKVIRKLLKKLKLKIKLLDSSIWNFSRELVRLAELDEKGIFYKVRPATIGFSRMGVDGRGSSEGIKKWIEKNI